MDPPSLPMIAYIFIGMSACILTYVTYSDEINKIPNAIAETIILNQKKEEFKILK